MSHIVESCALTKQNGDLSRLQSADEDTVSWLTSYGSWHAYEKKEDCLWRDPDDVSRCRILSCDKAEWRLITATLCRWKCCFLADQLWFMTHIWKQRLSVEDIFVIVDVVQCPFDRCSIVLNYLLTNVVLTDNCEWLLCVVSYSPNTVQNREVAISMMHRNDWNLSIIWNILCVNVHVTCARKHPLLTVECCYYAECGQCIQAKPEVSVWLRLFNFCCHCTEGDSWLSLIYL